MMPVRVLPPDIVNRLAKICGLFGSAHDGERAAAAYQATRLLQSAGLTWREFVEAAGPRHEQPTYAPTPPPPDWRQMVDVCGDYAFMLTPWEQEFVESLESYRVRNITPKQHAILERLYAKVMK